MRLFTPGRLGNLTHIRKVVGQVDHGIHIASKVYHAVAPHIPHSEAKSRIGKAVDDYASLREKIKRIN